MQRKCCEIGEASFGFAATLQHSLRWVLNAKDDMEIPETNAKHKNNDEDCNGTITLLISFFLDLD